MQNIVGQGFTPADSNIRFSARASPCPTKKDGFIRRLFYLLIVLICAIINTVNITKQW